MRMKWRRGSCNHLTKRRHIMRHNVLMKKGMVFAVSAMMAVGTCVLPVMAEDGSAEAVTDLPQIDMTKWQYNSEDDVWYQIGIQYCANPADLTYETLAVFVPGAYMDGTQNDDGTYTCTLNTENVVGNYSAETAPIVLPVNTPGYSAMAALTDYQSYTEYTSEGFVYVHAGCRGRDEGAPAGVTDLKAAIRYLRYNEGTMPGDTDAIFSFGMSGGGAQSAVLGASGDSDLYEPYLAAIGAVSGVSDAVTGAMCWCPITNLDQADEAYEWNLGSSRSGLDEETQALSDGLAEAYASYINEAGFTDEDGNVLVLEKSEEGIYQAGSYYEYIKGVIEDSLENFLQDTEFPYEASASSGGMGGPGGMMHGGRPDGDGGFPGGQGGFPGGHGGNGPDGNGGFPGGFDGAGPDGEEGFQEGTRGEMPDGGMPEGESQEDFGGEMPDGGMPEGESQEDFGGEMPETETSGADDSGKMENQNFEDMDQISRNDVSSSLDMSGTYETAQDYIDALNADGTWVTYDEETGEVTITSVEAFVKAMKPASKNVGAFDDLNESQGENTLFGYGDGEGAHFDAVEASLLEGTEYEQAFAEDLAREDALGNTADVRLDMYTPLYYLMESYAGYETSNPAEYWRIRTGIEQGDTALSTEVNLMLALQNSEDVESVDFETVWGLGHTMAERTGSSTDSFISWVNECMADMAS